MPQTDLAPVTVDVPSKSKIDEAIAEFATAMNMYDPLRFRAWRPGDDMAPGAHGISAPLPGAAIVQPSLLIVPLLACDAQGWRLGYGAGYYDRTLEAYAAAGTAVTAVGVAYAAQRVPLVPHDGGDVPLDALVTESGAQWFDKP